MTITADRMRGVKANWSRQHCRQKAFGSVQREIHTMARKKKFSAFAVILALLGGGAYFVSENGIPDFSTQEISAPESAASGSAADALEKLLVKGKAAKTGYSRAQFGPAWKDIDKNGCDQRNDILKRDLTKATFKPGQKQCVVLTGILADPFTGKDIQHERGNNAIDIDHIVALGQAWVSGAQQLTPQKREQLANDPLNLAAVSASENRSKGDREASAWIPKNKSARCSYVSAQIQVKTKYELSVTKAEKKAMQDVLAKCPGQKLVGAADIKG